MTEQNTNSGSQITCPHCGQTYAVRPEQWPQYQGRTIACTKCGQQFVVGGPASAAPPPLAPVAAQGGYPQQGAPGYAPAGGYPPTAYPPQGYYPPPVKKGLSGGIIALIAVGGLALLIVPCLISILLPSLNGAREHANRVKCASNLRQIGLACIMYSNAQRDAAYPDALSSLIPSGFLSMTALTCPDTTSTPPTSAAQFTPGHVDYVYTGAGMTNQSGSNVVIAYEPLTNHRNEGSNVLYADGHVEWQTRAAMPGIISQASAGANQPGAVAVPAPATGTSVPKAPPAPGEE